MRRNAFLRRKDHGGRSLLREDVLIYVRLLRRYVKKKLFISFIFGLSTMSRPCCKNTDIPIGRERGSRRSMTALFWILYSISPQHDQCVFLCFM
jgi:hypothetical protein